MAARGGLLRPFNVLEHKTFPIRCEILSIPTSLRLLAVYFDPLTMSTYQV